MFYRPCLPCGLLIPVDIRRYKEIKFNFNLKKIYKESSFATLEFVNTIPPNVFGLGPGRSKSFLFHVQFKSFSLIKGGCYPCGAENKSW